MNPKTLQYLMGHSDISFCDECLHLPGLEDVTVKIDRMKVIEEVWQELEKISGEVDLEK